MAQLYSILCACLHDGEFASVGSISSGAWVNLQNSECVLCKLHKQKSSSLFSVIFGCIL